jgi:hypothetical protein
VVNDPLYNHTVFGPEKGKGGNIGKSDDDLIRDLINIHNAENWLGMDGDSDLMMSPALALPLPSAESSDSQGISDFSMPKYIFVHLHLKKIGFLVAIW